MSNSLAAIASEVNDSDTDYTPNKVVKDSDASDDSDEDEYGEDDAFDIEKGATALLSRSSPKARNGNSSGATKTDDAANRLVADAQGSTPLWTQLYGSSFSKNKYHPAVILRANRDGTYNVKFKSGTKMSGLSKTAFKLSRDEQEDKRFMLQAGERILCKKIIAPNKARMHDMATPAHLRKDKKKSNRKFSSDEDAAECTFAPKLKKKQDNGESKAAEADFLVRMEAKENSRRVELERKRFELKKEARDKKKSGKRMDQDGVDTFLKRLAKAEATKKQRYKKLQKEMRPTFNITERMSYDEATGKIVKVSVKREAPDTAAFLARLEADAANKKEKQKQREMAATMGSPNRRSHSSPSRGGDDEYSATYEY